MGELLKSLKSLIHALYPNALKAKVRVYKCAAWLELNRTLTPCKDDGQKPRSLLRALCPLPRLLYKITRSHPSTHPAW